ncbi:MAG: hypothetical protein ACEY3J_04735, partial [Arsenophonus sp.]
QYSYLVIKELILISLSAYQLIDDFSGILLVCTGFFSILWQRLLLFSQRNNLCHKIAIFS